MLYLDLSYPVYVYKSVFYVTHHIYIIPYCIRGVVNFMYKLYSMFSVMCKSVIYIITNHEC